MTFKNVIIKNFNYNIKKYTAFFICNIFSMAIFYIFLSLIFNSSLKRYAGGGFVSFTLCFVLVMSVFSVIFIRCLSGYFIRKRKKEFALYMSIGMREKRVYSMLAFEGTLIILISYLAAMVIGSSMSVFFLRFFENMMGIPKTPFMVEKEPYIFTALNYGFIYFVSFIIEKRKMQKSSIKEMFSEEHKKVSLKKQSKIFQVVGALFIISSLVIMYYVLKDKSNNTSIIFLDLAVYLIGLYFFMVQSGRGILYKFIHGGYFNRRKFFLRELQQRFEGNKGIMYLCCLLSSIFIFIIGSVYVFYLMNIHVVKSTNIGDFMYVQNYRVNNINFKDLKLISDKYHTPISKYKSIEFVVFNKNGIKIQCISSDDYIKNIDPIRSVPEGEVAVVCGSTDYYKNNLKGKGVKLLPFDKTFYYSQDAIISSLAGNNIVMPKLYILNNKDFEMLKTEVDDIDVFKINIVDFQNPTAAWKTVDAFKKNMKTYENKGDIGAVLNNKEGITSVSTVDYYKGMKAESSSIIFFTVIIGMVILISLAIVQYFKLFESVEEDKVKYRQLYRIGTGSKYISKNILKEFSVVFFTPVILGAVAGCFFISMFTAAYKSIKPYMMVMLFIPTFYILFQILIFVLSYFNYSNEVIKDAQASR